MGQTAHHHTYFILIMVELSVLSPKNPAFLSLIKFSDSLVHDRIETAPHYLHCLNWSNELFTTIKRALNRTLLF